MQTETEKNTMRIMGMRIVQRRKQFGMKQKELAKKVGLTENQVSNIENGVCFPRMGSFLKICEVLGTSPDFFLLGTIRHELSDDIVDMLLLCSPRTQKTVWLLLNAYLHQEEGRQSEGKQ